MRVERRMTQSVVTIGPGEGLQRALGLMRERRVLIARVEVTDFSAPLPALEEGGYPVLAATF